MLQKDRPVLQICFRLAAGVYAYYAGHTLAVVPAEPP